MIPLAKLGFFIAVSPRRKSRGLLSKLAEPKTRLTGYGAVNSAEPSIGAPQPALPRHRLVKLSAFSRRACRSYENDFFPLRRRRVIVYQSSDRTGAASLGEADGGRPRFVEGARAWRRRLGPS